MKRHLLVALIAFVWLANFNGGEARALGVVTSEKTSSTDVVSETDSKTTEETSDFTESSFGGVSFYEPKFGTAASSSTSSSSSSSTTSSTSTFGSSSSFGNFGDKSVSPSSLSREIKLGQVSGSSSSESPS